VTRGSFQTDEFGVALAPALWEIGANLGGEPCKSPEPENLVATASATHFRLHRITTRNQKLLSVNSSWHDGKETMSRLRLEDYLNGLKLADPECLPFCPTEDMKRRVGKFDDIPRYLFRVFTPRSRGTTDTSWTKSVDATKGASTSKVDIFARADNEQVAEMIYRHLRWWKGPEDNLVSWTSSLLFALVYIFHLRAN
jgi:hypothetical protein